MKKIIYLLFALLFPLCFMCGCSNNQTTEPTKIQLTTENYSQYISLNLVYGNFIVYENSSYCIATIKTSSAKDSLIFKDVKIEFTLSHNGWITYGPALNRNIIQAELSYNGISESSMSLWRDDTVIAPPSSHVSDIIVIAISGEVLEG